MVGMAMVVEIHLSSDLYSSLAGISQGMGPRLPKESSISTIKQSYTHCDFFHHR